MRVKLLTERPIGEKVREYLLSQGEEIVDDNPCIIVIAYYPRILKKKEYKDVPLGAINFHPGLLPYNRGMYPHIWPLIDGTPAGVTIHYINDKVDQGDIIAQKRIKVEPTDIASDLERKTQREILKLFKKVWPKIKAGKIKPKKQTGFSTYHDKKEIKYIQQFDAPTIFKLRACTFKDRSYGFFRHKGRKIYVGVKFFDHKP